MAALLIAAAASTGPASATVMTFDGVGLSTTAASTYTESGFKLTISGAPGPHYGDPDGGLLGPADTFGWHPSGFGSNNLVTLTKIGGGAFDIYSFDIAAYYDNDLSVAATGHGPTVFTSTGTMILDYTGVHSVTFDLLRDTCNDDWCGGIAIDNVSFDRPVENHDPDPEPTHSTPVPEPSTLATLALGLTGLGLVTRRRRKTA